MRIRTETDRRDVTRGRRKEGASTVKRPVSDRTPRSFRSPAFGLAYGVNGNRNGMSVSEGVTETVP